ncbi:MAG: enolase C-terminal domain-like protein [Bryobacteraceae bacterium]
MKVRGLTVRPVDVPLRRPLQTAGGLVATAPLVLLDLHTTADITGSSYVFCYTPIALQPLTSLLRNLDDVIRDGDAAPLALEQTLQSRFRLLGPQGLTGMACAAIDMAAWDAAAKAARVPLARLLGASLDPIPAYNSCGLGLIGPDRARVEAVELLDRGFRALKVRLGYPDLETDLAVVRAVREGIGPDILLMSDYNQSLSVPEAIRRIRALDDERLAWVEEPVAATDYTGHAQVRAAVRTPIQTGENWWGTPDMSKSVAAGASDFVMADATKIGGPSGWLRAASLAAACALPLSSHLLPEISTHLLAASPTRHWLEYVDFASPILQQPVRIENGHAVLSGAPGAGIAWDESAIALLA